MKAEATTEEIEKAETATPAGEPVIIVRRVFEANPAHVFAAWTDPDVIGAWWGPNGFTTTTRSFDFQEGGTWDFTMHGPDGADYPNSIRYAKIVAPERIIYDHRSSAAHPGGFRNTVTFAPCEEGTRLTMEMQFPDLQERDKTARAGAVEGGKQTLARLAAHVEAPA